MENRLTKLIDELLDLRRRWEQRRLEAENQVKALDAKLTAYQTTIKDCWESDDSDERGDKDTK